MKLTVLFFTILFLTTSYVNAHKQIYSQPVHLDDSGKPVVNSWKKMEDQRQQKKIVQEQTVSQKGADKDTCTTTVKNGPVNPHCIPAVSQKVVPQTKVVSVSNDQVVSTGSGTQPQTGVVVNTATHVDDTLMPTPTSVIVNRPVQTKGDPKSDDFNF